MIQKLKESSVAVGVLIIIVGICFLSGASEINSTLFVNFIICSVLIIIGQFLFFLGIDQSLLKVGKHSGSALMKIGKIWLILIFGFLLGFLATIAEPDVQVLADLVSPVGNYYIKLIFISVLGLGVAIMTLIAYMRILKNIPLKYVLIAIYLIILILSIFAPQNYVLLAFDSSGTTTGVITVPFLLSLTLGICHVRAINKKDDNFGVIAIATSGSIITILIMSFFLPVQAIDIGVSNVGFFEMLLANLIETTIALLPLLFVFIVLQITYFKFPKNYVIKILVGFLTCGLGLTLFLTGALYGYAPIGEFLGEHIGSKIVLIVLSAVFGLVLIFTEPSVKVLLMQIDEVSTGLIKRKYVYIALCIASSLSLILATLRVFYDFSFWWYVLVLVSVALILMFFIPPIFCSIAFDSGGVVAGTILASFVLPFYIGMSKNLYNTGSHALGMIMVMTLMPIISIEILGLIYKYHENKIKKGDKL